MMPTEVQYRANPNVFRYYFALSFLFGSGLFALIVLVQDISSYQTKLFGGPLFALPRYLLMSATLFAICAVGSITSLMMSDRERSKKRALTAMKALTILMTIFAVLYIVVFFGFSRSGMILDAANPHKILGDENLSKEVSEMQQNLKCCGIYSFKDWNNIKGKNSGTGFLKQPVSCFKEIEVARQAYQQPGLIVKSPMFPEVKYFRNLTHKMIQIPCKIRFEDMIHKTGCWWEESSRQWTMIKHLQVIDIFLVLFMWLGLIIIKIIHKQSSSPEEVLWHTVVLRSRAGWASDARIIGL